MAYILVVRELFPKGCGADSDITSCLSKSQWGLDTWYTLQSRTTPKLIWTPPSKILSPYVHSRKHKKYVQYTRQNHSFSSFWSLCVYFQLSHMIQLAAWVCSSQYDLTWMHSRTESSPVAAVINFLAFHHLIIKQYLTISFFRFYCQLISG